MSKFSVGCFLIGVCGKFTKNSEALLGSVSDDPYDVRTFMKVVKSENELTHIGTELTSTSEHTLEERGYFARFNETTRGINESGLAFTSAMVFEDKNTKKASNATDFADVTEFIMKNCKSVEDAISAFSEKKAIFPAYSVLLADNYGSLAHIEVGSYGTAVNHHYSKGQSGIVMAVNCYQSPDFIKYNMPESLMTNKKNNNVSRFERGKILAEKFKGNFSVEVLKQILSDHENNLQNPLDNPLLEGWGYSICNHGTLKKDNYQPENLPWGTVSSEILQPSKKLFWYAYGWPCGQKPEYKDQIFQQNSWGKFIPFGFLEKNHIKATIALTTVDGEITKTGLKMIYE